jgi:hypothetical protein
MDRLFAFGCSFTHYHWPTWADIVGKEYKKYENWGKPGGGNSFIFYSLIECIKRNQINKHDTVMIMWSSIGREDRYIRKQGWLTPGSIYNQSYYDSEFVKKFADPTGYLLRDLAHISASRQILENIGCNYYFMTIVPFSIYDDNTDNEFDIDQQILDLYQDDVSIIYPSVYEVIFNKDWYSRPGLVKIKELKQEYENLQGADWPSWQEFIVNEINVNHTILKELEPLIKKLHSRTDTHPLPTEHLEYILKTLPIKISDSTINWVNNITNKLLKDERINVPQFKAKRF